MSSQWADFVFRYQFPSFVVIKINTTFENKKMAAHQLLRLPDEWQDTQSAFTQLVFVSQKTRGRYDVISFSKKLKGQKKYKKKEEKFLSDALTRKCLLVSDECKQLCEKLHLMLKPLANPKGSSWKDLHARSLAHSQRYRVTSLCTPTTN